MTSPATNCWADVATRGALVLWVEVVADVAEWRYTVCAAASNGGRATLTILFVYLYIICVEGDKLASQLPSFLSLAQLVEH